MPMRIIRSKSNERFQYLWFTDLKCYVIIDSIVVPKPKEGW